MPFLNRLAHRSGIMGRRLLPVEGWEKVHTRPMLWCSKMKLLYGTYRLNMRSDIFIVQSRFQGGVDGVHSCVQ